MDIHFLVWQTRAAELVGHSCLGYHLPKLPLVQMIAHITWKASKVQVLLPFPVNMTFGALSRMLIVTLLSTELDSKPCGRLLLVSAFNFLPVPSIFLYFFLDLFDNLGAKSKCIWMSFCVLINIPAVLTPKLLSAKAKRQILLVPCSIA